jgi:hypothetical protein
MSFPDFELMSGLEIAAWCAANGRSVHIEAELAPDGGVLARIYARREPDYELDSIDIPALLRTQI